MCVCVCHQCMHMHWCSHKRCTCTRLTSTPVRRCSHFQVFDMGTISTYLEIQNLPNKPSKSTTGHDAVADVLLHWHHLIIIVGADSILLVNGSPSLFASDAIHHISGPAPAAAPASVAVPCKKARKQFASACIAPVTVAHMNKTDE